MSRSPVIPNEGSTVMRPAATAAVVATLLCVPAAVALPALAGREADAAEAEQARTAAATAAKQAVEDVLSYDYRTVDKDIARARSEATGQFAEQYDASAQQLADQAKQSRAIVQATSSAPAIVAADGGQVVVLLFVDQASVKQLDDAGSPTTRIDQSRVGVSMTRVGDRWLISQLAAL
jgi:Mce-associated membrane protein